MPITALPTPPNRADPPATFISRADAFLGALPTFAAQANALEAAVDADAVQVAADRATASANANAAAASAAAAVSAVGYAADSATSLAVSAGSKSLTLAQTGKAFAVNDQVVLMRRADPAVRMSGAITAFTSGTGAMTVNVLAAGVEGSGTFTDWLVVLAALVPLSRAQTQAMAIAFAVSL
jgi:hypothetical protein